MNDTFAKRSMKAYYVKDYLPEGETVMGINRTEIVAQLKQAGILDKRAAHTAELLDRIKFVNLTPNRTRLSFRDDNGNPWDIMLFAHETIERATRMMITEPDYKEPKPETING